MKHLLNDLSSDERNRILEQHRGGMSLGKKGGSKEEKISDISFDDEIKGNKGDLMLVRNPRTGKTELPGMGPKGSSGVKLKTKKYVDGVLKTFDSEGNEIED
jgi:hypothetical protein